MDLSRPALLGTVAWLVALLGLLLLGDAVGPVPRWWTWTAATGVLLGLLGVLAVRLTRPQPPGRTSAADDASA